MDIYSKKKRSQIMAGILGKNTKPEIYIRKVLFANGYRFRINYQSLPGKPDIVLPKYKVAIFIHGCFWHQHKGCKKSKLPSSNELFWSNKIKQNVRRDKRYISLLKRKKWNVFVIWECKIQSSSKLLLKKIEGKVEKYGKQSRNS
jgi:DNA mismatch endonuclease, patch repair protein